MLSRRMQHLIDRTCHLLGQGSQLLVVSIFVLLFLATKHFADNLRWGLDIELRGSA